MQELKEAVLVNHKDRLVFIGAYGHISNMRETKRSQVETFYFYTQHARDRFIEREIHRRYPDYVIEQYIL